MTHSPRQHMKDAPVRRPTTPTALRVGPSDDTFEREADRAADAVTRGGLAPWINALPGDGGVRRKCDACAKEDDEGTLRRDAAGGDAGGWSAPPIVSDVLRSPGRPLDAPLRAEMERGFGHDFSRVRVHDDAMAAESARAVSAHAYTVGDDIVFAAPASASGKRVVAHELAHVVQNARAGAPGRLSTLRRAARPALRHQDIHLPHLSDEELRGLGKQALDTMGYDELIRRAVAAGLVPAREPRHAAPPASTAPVLRRQATFADAYAPWAAAAAVASQLDSPLPGPGDLAALGILAIGAVVVFAAASRVGTCSCQHRDIFTSGGVSCQTLRETGTCTGPYTGVGVDGASCQAAARLAAPAACRGCLGHCQFRR